MRTVLICRDLFFSSQIAGTAKLQGLEMTMVLGLPSLKKEVEKGPIDLCLYQLKTANTTPAEVLSCLAGSRRPYLVAFGPHVETTLFEVARQAGFDEVLPNSKLSAQLPDLLAAWAAKGAEVAARGTPPA